MRRLLINTLAFGLFFPGMIRMLFELDWIENVAGGPWFVLLVLGVAAFPAYLAGRAIARAAKADGGISRFAGAGAATDPNREAAAGFLSGVGILVLALGTASWFNHEFARSAADVQAMVIGRKHGESTPRSPEEWRLVVSIAGRREDVAVSAGEWARSVPGARVEVRMLDGALGFPVLCSQVLPGRCGRQPILPSSGGES